MAPRRRGKKMRGGGGHGVRASWRDATAFDFPRPEHPVAHVHLFGSDSETAGELKRYAAAVREQEGVGGEAFVDIRALRPDTALLRRLSGMAKEARRDFLLSCAPEDVSQ